ncbi:MAG: ADP-ribosylglycohydrolase family protein [Coleofasciculaceae cyanobacterium]
MRYSLLSQFRGALLGSLVGEILGSNKGRMPSRLLLKASSDQDNQSLVALATQLNWSQIATCGIESLIHCGRLDLEDWQLRSSKVESLSLLKNTANSSEAALATLPIALFFHDDQSKLRQQLQQAAAHWQQTEENEGVLAVGYAIALALTEKLNHTLIPQILSYLGNAQTRLGQQLQQVQNLIDKGAALNSAVHQLRQEAKLQGGTDTVCAIALAFYCFLSTPEDFRLSLSRASLITYQPQLTSALTGALAGAYNSNMGIPIGWRLEANQINMSIQRLKLSEQLLAVWSGAYGVSVIEPLPWAAIAAPRVIRLG